MWDAQLEVEDNGRIQKRRLHRPGGEPLRYAEVIELWQQDPKFQVFFTELLAGAPYPAFFWETPPITSATLRRPFEYVLLDAPILAGVEADPRMFETHFMLRDGSEGVITFANLGGDSLLVAPYPVGSPSAYPHLAAFVRNAERSQHCALWRYVATALKQRIGDQPLWLSTSGLGVAWLHVRLDTRPKYYEYAPYREI